MEQQKKESRLTHIDDLGEPIIFDGGTKPPDDILVEVEAEITDSQKIDHSWPDFWKRKLPQDVIVALSGAALLGVAKLLSQWGIF